MSCATRHRSVDIGRCIGRDCWFSLISGDLRASRHMLSFRRASYFASDWTAKYIRWRCTFLWTRRIRLGGHSAGVSLRREWNLEWQNFAVLSFPCYVDQLSALRSQLGVWSENLMKNLLLLSSKIGSTLEKHWVVLSTERLTERVTSHGPRVRCVSSGKTRLRHVTHRRRDTVGHVCSQVEFAKTP